MGPFKRFGLVASLIVVLVIVIGASALVGCMRTRYVYVDSAGVRHESDRPLNERDIEIADLRPDPDDASLLRGTWTGHGNWSADVPAPPPANHAEDGHGRRDTYSHPLRHPLRPDLVRRRPQRTRGFCALP